MIQGKHTEWIEQWEMFESDDLFLFDDWIIPYKLSDFRGKHVLECGCGGGQHTNLMAPFAKSITAVDLNTIDIAENRNSHNDNIIFIEEDIANMDLGNTFDFVLSIGVVHHTDDPNRTVSNLKRHVKQGGYLILWVYSHEGNFLLRSIVEPLRKIFLTKLKRSTLLRLSTVLTVILYIPVFTIYRVGFRFLPYYEYFGNFRRLTFQKNLLNVFDKLNSPQVTLVTESQARSWIPEHEYEDIYIDSYKNVSWRISGKKK